MRVILDSHPSLACPPESKFLAGVEAFINYPQALRGLDSLGVPPREVLACVGGLVLKVFEQYAQARGKSRWCDKTPNYYRLLDLIDLLLGEQWLHICLVRHPLDTVDSLMRVGAFSQDTVEDPDIAWAVRTFGRSRAGFAQYWQHVMRSLISSLGSRSRRTVICRYEDLVRRPAAVVSGVLSFLDEGMPSDICSSWASREHERGYGDTTIRTARGIYTSSMDRWLSWPVDESDTAWRLVASEASVFGYTLAPFGSDA